MNEEKLESRIFDIEHISDFEISGHLNNQISFIAL